MKYGLRYMPNSDLGRRFPGDPDEPRFDSREAAESLRRLCINANFIEVFEVDE